MREYYLSAGLHGSMGGNVLYVEVKGTETLGETVLLTKNEVRQTRETRPQVALAILQSIRCKARQRLLS